MTEGAERLEVTPEMVSAGVAVLFWEYDSTFDPLENNAEHFVTRIFQAMMAKTPKAPLSHGLEAAKHASRGPALCLNAADNNRKL